METFFRHRHGGGKKYGSSEACPRTYLSKTTALRGNTEVYESVIDNASSDEIIDSFIHEAQIFNSTVINSKITGKPRLENSLVACPSVAGCVRIINSVVEGESRISGSSEIVNSSFKNLSVGGTARILDWNDFFKHTTEPVFDGAFGRITCGIWLRPPRVVRFDDLQMTITESIGGRAFVGCLEKPITRWISGGHRFGRVNGWNSEQVERLIALFNDWLANPISNI